MFCKSFFFLSKFRVYNIRMTQSRWKITVEYDGSGYAGWQRQEERLPTIQKTIEDALLKFCQQEITVHGAGRTDSGVHARGQVAHFDLDYGDRSLTGFDLAKALNAHIRPQPVAIVKAELVDDDFHARFAAKQKLYTYRIVNRRSFLALDQNRAWLVKKELDVDAMADAASVLVGKHDFTTFRDSGCQSKNPVRTVDSIDVEALSYDDFGGREIRFHVQGQSFLHFQVRNFVGSLKMVGEGKWTKKDLKQALDAKDRTKGGPTAPADGLCLVRIEYP